MKGKRIASAVLVCIALFVGGNVLFGETTFTDDQIGGALTMVWIIMCAALVFFMQAGFTMVEVGLTRAKNAGNIIMKNLLDFSFGALAYWAVGWAFMYGESAGGFIGTSQFFLNAGVESDPGILRDWMFQVVFAATASTIVSGAMAERTKFPAYLVYAIVVSAVIYPISGHWTWSGDGWLAQLGFHDFAGSSIVHGVGAWLALAGAIVVGPRLGKYAKVGGKTISKAIPGHNLPLAALGVFILWFGWFGFNGGSTLDGMSADIGHVVSTTTLSAAAGAVAAVFTSWIMFGKPDVSMGLNGALAGLVGITAGAWVVNPLAAVIIGLISGIVVVLSVEFLDKVLHVDDPVGAISVHGSAGVWGTLAVGLFADGGRDSGIVGLFYGGGAEQLGKQAIGVLAYFAWAFVLGLLLFLLIKVTIGIRVSEKEEREGLDINEHAADAYPGFQIFSNL